MDEDWITGAAQKLTGSAKDAAGSALGDTKLQAEGKTDKVAGTVRNTVGGAMTSRVNSPACATRFPG